MVRRLLVGLVLCGCSSLVGLDDAPASSSSSSGQAGESESSSGEPDAASSSSGHAASSSGSASSGSSSGGTSSSGSSSSGGAPAQPLAGPLQTVAENLVGGEAVLLTPERLYWIEQGDFHGDKSDALLASIGLATSCPAGTNCGGVVSNHSGFPYFTSYFVSGPRWGSEWTCIAPISSDGNARLECLDEQGGGTYQLGAALPDATLTTIYDGFAYVVRPNGGTAHSGIEKVALQANAQFQNVILRDAVNILDAAIDENGLVWSESTGTGSVVFQRAVDGTITQLGQPHPGRATLALDQEYVYEAFDTAGIVLRHQRTAPFTEEPIADGRNKPMNIRRGGAFVFWLDAGPGDMKASAKVLARRADSNGDIVELDAEPYIHGFDVNDTDMVAATFTNDSVEEPTGTIKRVRFVP